MNVDELKTIAASLGSLIIIIGFYILTNNLGSTLILAGLFTFILHLSIKEE